MLSVEFETQNKEVAAYAVVLLFSSGAEQQAIRVYDSTHGFNEMHRYSRIGGKQAGTAFHSGTLGEGMREQMSRDNGYRSPAGQVMDEAIELAVEERSPYPSRSTFLNADMPLPDRERAMRRAAEEGQSVVLVSPDRSTRVIAPDKIIGADTAQP